MKHFTKDEFKCGCGCNLNFDNMSYDLINKLVDAREMAGVPFRITSSIRCKKHNRTIGGSPTSSHLSGEAIDILCDSSITRFHILGGLIAAGFNRIGVGDFFIHADVDKEKYQEVIWLYN